MVHLFITHLICFYLKPLLINSIGISVPLAILIVSSSSTALGLQESSKFDFYTRGPYREAVPKPETILNFDVGDFHTNYAMMERVIYRIAQDASDRVRIIDIGRTNEHRMMHLIAITSPENLKRLEEIKLNIRKLSDPRSTSPQEAKRIADTTPAIVWFNFNIHGNESAGVEAMMQVLYQLAASNEAATMGALQNCLVLINACANPDGHERFVTWYNSYGIGNADPAAGEHEEPWSVNGRFNRYRFDLNRDNLISTQVETRNTQRAFLEWQPQVFADFHGQPSQYFFPPSASPINPNYPKQTTKWPAIYGRANAAQFDQHKWDYYVRDVFDLFYPGYCDSWSSLNGATGMTYETDGGGPKGLNWKRDDETIVTFRSAIAKHFVAAMTTLETTSINRVERLNDYYEFKRSAIEEGRKEKLRYLVISPLKDPSQTAEFIEILLRQGIEVQLAQEPFKSSTAYKAVAPTLQVSNNFPAGSYIVDLAQPQKRLAKAILETHTEQDADFIRDQIAKFRRNEIRGSNATREEYGFYDITSWSLPIAFGVDAYWIEDVPKGLRTATLVDASSTDHPPTPNLKPAGGITGRANVAYIIPYQTNRAASLIYRLQREGFKPAVATRKITAAGREWPRGTVVVRTSRNPDTIHEAIDRLAKETGVQVTAVNSGFIETGDTSVGSETVVSMKRPRIAVVADTPAYQMSYGAIWWLFDSYGVDFTPVSIGTLLKTQLDKYNVIILPDGSPSRYLAAFGKGGAETLKGWVERGGTLICIKGAAVFATSKDVNLTSSRLVGSEQDDQKAAQVKASAEATSQPDKRLEKEDKSTERKKPQIEESEKKEGAAPEMPPMVSPSAKPGQVPEAVPGAIMWATLDKITPLTYGYDEATLPVILHSSYFFRPTKMGTNAVVFDGNANRPLHIAGFIWPDNTEKLLRGTSYLLAEPSGRGHVVLYSEDPIFRGMWMATARLLFNSILFLPAS